MLARPFALVLLALFGAAFFCPPARAQGTTVFEQSSGGLKIRAELAFPTLWSESTPRPWRITVENSGPAAEGLVQASANAYSMNYPISLPEGSQKSFMAYVPSLGWNTETRFLLRTNQGQAALVADPGMSTPTSIGALIVSDVEGVGAFMRRKIVPTSDFEILDFYAKPGEVPDRLVGLLPFRYVLLGEGSERLSDAEVAAIQGWLVGGGSLFVFDGPSAPIFQDPRWEKLLELSRASATIQPSNSGAPAGTIKASVTPVGYGRLAYLSRNLLEPPLNRWEGRAAFLDELVNLDETASTHGVSAVLGYSPSAPIEQYSRTEEANPFSIELPPTSRVGGIIAAFIVLVIPVNFIVLRKLKRSEWAWWTAPAISLAFAAVLFSSAGSLYDRTAASSVRGSVYYDASLDTAWFAGVGQAFFPRAGRYDLKLGSLDYIAPSGSAMLTAGVTGALGTFRNMEAVDVGEILITNYRATNLSFAEFSMVQRAPSLRGLSYDPNAKKLTNGTPWTLRAVKVQRGTQVVQIDKIEPGETKVLLPGTEAPDPTGGTPWSVQRDVLTAEFETNDLGPQVGERSYIELPRMVVTLNGEVR